MLSFPTEMYAEEVRSGICDGKAFPTIINETPATGFVNGNNAIGMVKQMNVARRCNKRICLKLMPSLSCRRVVFFHGHDGAAI